MNALAPPLIVTVTRGPLPESRHFVHAVVVDPTGETVAAWGDPERLTHPRSAVKMLQSLPVVETGAADRFGLSEADLALCCASHQGEQQHLDSVRAFLSRIGAREGELACGPQSDEATSPVTNNCSGKHAGFLAVAHHLGVDPIGYVRADHTVQRLVTETLADAMDAPMNPSMAGIDGCGIPAYAVALRSLACGVARFVHPPSTWSGDRVAAAARLRRAMTAHPWLVAGTGRLDTDLMSAAAGDVVAKRGAEGVQVAGVVSAGLAVAVKAEDGAGRAAEVALGHVLASVGVDRYDAVFAPRHSIGNRAGAVVGRISVAET